jgi:hypothetical protein
MDIFYKLLSWLFVAFACAFPLLIIVGLALLAEYPHWKKRKSEKANQEKKEGVE